MPTGYTAIIDNNPGVTFSDFVWCCARAFGALVLMRDEPADTPIPELKPSPFYEESVRKAEVELAEIRALNNEEAEARMRAEYDQKLKQSAEWRAKEASAIARYEAMRERVVNWQAPSPDHQGLKRFMLEQLTTGAPSLDWCQPPEPPTMSAAVWLAEKINNAEGKLFRAKRSLQEELDRTRKRNEWIHALRESVPMPEKLKV